MRAFHNYIPQAYILLIVLMLSILHVPAQNHNEGSSIFTPDLGKIFKGESVSSVVDTWEKNGITTSKNTPEDLLTTLHSIYEKHKNNSESIIVIEGFGEAEDLRAAMLQAEANALINIVNFNSINVTEISSIYVIEGSANICLDNLTTLEVVQTTENAKNRIWRFYVLFIEDIDCRSTCLNCCQVHLITHMENSGFFTNNSFIFFPNDSRRIFSMIRSVPIGNQEMATQELVESTREGEFWFRDINGVEEIINSN